MKNVKKSIQRLLLERFFVILVSLLVILCVYQNKNMKNYILKSKAEDLNERILDINENVAINSDEMNDDKITDNLEDVILKEIKTQEVSVLIVNKDGNVIISKEANFENSIIELSKDEYLKILSEDGDSAGYKIIKGDNNSENIVVWRKINIENGSSSTEKAIIQISAQTEASKLILKDEIRMFVISTTFIIFLGGILAYTVSKYTLKPLKDITYSVDNLDTADIKSRIDIESEQKEIEILKNSFNSMLDKIEKSYQNEAKTNESMKIFIMDASHELRTPLTAIKGFIEVLELGVKNDKEKLDMALSSMYKEADRLTRLVNNLILLTRLEGDMNYDVSRVNIDFVIGEIQEQLQILSKKRKLTINIDKDIYLEINKDHLKQIIYNLVQNAINHTDEENGEIILSVNKYEENEVKIIVKDNGEGISEENIQKVFDRFFRSKEDRASKKSGYGLGLSIVKSIIDRYNGKISVKSEQGKGASFEIIFDYK